MRKKLRKSFYSQPTLKVAQNLIGKFLIHKTKDNVYAAPIIETEAYCGFEDKASHASRGMTERNKVMFEAGGRAYVYLIYGMYHCLNIVTEYKGCPSAVLIRALDYPKADGPGKLCREFEITKDDCNNTSLLTGSLWIEDRGFKVKEISTGRRIGIDYAGESKKLPWRFFID